MLITLIIIEQTDPTKSTYALDPTVVVDIMFPLLQVSPYLMDYYP